MKQRASVAPKFSMMPDLIRPTRGLRHRVESAVNSLRALGLTEDAILIEAVGGGWARGTVVEQEPAPGTPLQPGQRVRLGVSGPGALHALRRSAGETRCAPFVASSRAVEDLDFHGLHHARTA